MALTSCSNGVICRAGGLGGGGGIGLAGFSLVGCLAGAGAGALDFFAAGFLMITIWSGFCFL